MNIIEEINKLNNLIYYFNTIRGSPEGLKVCEDIHLRIDNIRLDIKQNYELLINTIDILLSEIFDKNKNNVSLVNVNLLKSIINEKL